MSLNIFWRMMVIMKENFMKPYMKIKRDHCVKKEFKLTKWKSIARCFLGFLFYKDQLISKRIKSEKNNQWKMKDINLSFCRSHTSAKLNY